MHVIYVGYWYDRDLRSIDDLFARCPTINDFPAAIAAAGAEVTVIQRFVRPASFRRNGVAFRFVADECRPQLRWQIPARFHDEIAKISRRSDEVVAHVNGLNFPLQVRALRRELPSGAMIAQHHAERPWTGLKRPVQRHGLRAVNAFLFASAQLSHEWVTCGAIAKTQPVHEVMESPACATSQQGPCIPANSAPRLLWVGRLNRNKDPLTVLAAFEHLLECAPTARLEMIFQGGELFETVNKRVTDSRALSGSVTLIGEVPHDELSRHYLGADFYIVGSRHEGSGYALSEAMAHNVVPVVTRIPSFARMTDGAGYLWTPGDANECTQALIRALRTPIERQRELVMRSYNSYLSAEAVGSHAVAAYRSTLETQRRCE